MNLIAFHNDKKIKATYLKRVRAHAKADEIVKGKYWENGKGCAVGCTIHSSNHVAYETELGIPEWLARVEDTLFEGMSPTKAKQWPAKFLSAIPIGADLEKAKTPFIIMILESTLKSMSAAKFDKVAFPDVQKALEGSAAAVKEMIRCHREGLDLNAAESARSAARSAWSAARSARSAARSAESAAESAARSAWSAAESAWSAAESAARSAWSAAESAARSAWSAAESAARSAARSATHDSYADQLLVILKGLTPKRS